MIEFKGTKGPWKVNTIGQHWNNASLTHIEVTFGPDGECVCDTVYEMADANLIAAAPDLLNMLQATTLYIEKNANDGSGIVRAVLDASNAAIAKALGQ